VCIESLSTKSQNSLIHRRLTRSRVVVVHTGVSLSAIFYATHLPEILPDYVIYDASDWTSRRGRILNGRPVLAGGFFNADWAL
jgi:hypothetical protein